MSVVESVIQVGKYFIDRRINWYLRLGTLFLLILIAMAIDGITGITDAFVLKDKATNILKMQSILNDPNIDSSVKREIQQDILYIAKRKSMHQQLVYLFYKDNPIPTSKTNTNVDEDLKSVSLGLFWLIISSVGVFIVIFIDIIPTMWEISQRETVLNKQWRVLFFLMEILVFGGMVMFLSYAINNFPLIWNAGTVGRVASNLCYQFLIIIVFLVSYYSKRKIKSKS